MLHGAGQECKPIKGALVIGGGPAGLAVAIHLARAGRVVQQWDKARLPGHHICTDLITPEAELLLADLGLVPNALGASKLHYMRLIAGEHVAELDLGELHAGLSGRSLISALQDTVVKAGVDLRLGTALREIGRGRRVRQGHDWYQPRHLMLAGGHGQPDLSYGTHVVFKSYLRLSSQVRAEMEGGFDKILFPGGHVTLTPVEREMTSLRLVVSKSHWPKGHVDFDYMLRKVAAVSPLFLSRLEGAVPLLDRPLAEGGALKASGPILATNWLIGDALTGDLGLEGDGLSAALHGAGVAVANLLMGRDPAAYVKAVSRDIRAPLERAGRFDDMLHKPEAALKFVRLVSAMPFVGRSALGALRFSKKAISKARATLKSGF